MISESTTGMVEGDAMKFRGRIPPAWLREVAHELPTPRVTLTEPILEPQPGDIVVKPVIERHSHARRFRVETWDTHDLLGGPFLNVDEAREAALELAVIGHLVVWLDESDEAGAHTLEPAPLYRADPAAARTRSVA